MIHEFTLLAIVSSVAAGGILAIPECIWRRMAERIGTPPEHAHSLVALHRITMVALMPVAGWIVDTMHHGAAIAGSSLLVGLGVFLIGMSRDARMALAGLAVLAIGSSLFVTSAIVLLPLGFFVDQTSAALNLGMANMLLGGLIAPVLCELLWRGWGWRRGVGVLAVLCLVPAAFAALIFSDGPETVDSPATGLFTLLGVPGVWFAGVALGVYLLIEYTFSLPAPSLPSADRPRVLFEQAEHGFWWAMIAGRLAMCGVLVRGWMTDSQPWLLLLLAVILVIVLGNAGGATRDKIFRPGKIMAGLCLGPMFPGLIAIVFANVSPGARGTAFGLMYAVGAFINLGAAPLLREWKHQREARDVVRLCMLLALVFAGAMLVLGLTASTLMF